MAALAEPGFNLIAVIQQKSTVQGTLHWKFWNILTLSLTLNNIHIVLPPQVILKSKTEMESKTFIGGTSQ